MQFRIIQNRRNWYFLSGALVIAAIVSLFAWGLKFGIDFTGGTLIEATFIDERPSVEQMSQALDELDYGDISLQPAGESDVILRLRDVTEDEHQAVLTALRNSVEGGSAALVENRFETIGPAIGQELARKAFSALVLSIIFIILYIAYAFRKVSEPVASWKFGVTAIIALVHDVLIITGVFAVLGFALQVEVGAMFVTALLTILGFSVHDTIVVFDRTRENLFLSKKRDDFEDIVNTSVNQTIWRSVNTSVSTLFVLGAIFFFGGESIKYFTLALMLGIVIGTYSSIFVASPLIVDWFKLGKKR
ncbi:MAG: protein translocase subunit SecF [Patescibacteria group bacterium]